MSKKPRFTGVQGSVKIGTVGNVSFLLPLFIFEEEGATICYCPALDVSGYGYSEQAAMDSFKYVVGEYFDYTIKKRTLTQDLRRLGWVVKNSLRKKMSPPPVTRLLERNDNFKRVFENYDYKKMSTSVEIPAFA